MGWWYHVQYYRPKQFHIDGYLISYKLYMDDDDDDKSDQGYHQVKVQGAAVQRVVLTDLIAATTYRIRMQSFNAFGSSQYSNTAVKETLGM